MGCVCMSEGMDGWMDERYERYGRKVYESIWWASGEDVCLSVS